MTDVIDPRTVLVAIPTHSGQIHAECVGGLVSCGGLFAEFLPLSECSHPSLVRNTIADYFMRSKYEWLVSIDADTGFTPRDYQLLMQPMDTEANYTPPGDAEPTRTEVLLGEAGQPVGTCHKGNADLLVCAEYAYKKEPFEPVKLGMGFVRIHRTVFERLQALEHERNPQVDNLLRIKDVCSSIATEMEANNDGITKLSEELRNASKEISQNLPEPGGGPRLWTVTRNNRVFWDYFPSGPIISTIVPTAEWKGEDHGFFTLCFLAGIVPRIERRTRLVHIGRKGYPYQERKGGMGQ